MLDLLDSVRQVILRGSVAAATVTFFDGDVVADPGTVSVSITRDDGTSVRSGTASGTGTAARTFALTSVETAELDVLTAEWTSTEFGTLTTCIEIVGGFAAAIGQINAVLDQRGEEDTPNSADVPLAMKAAARTIATDALERECRMAFSPRYARDKLDGVSGYDLLLPTPNVLSVRSITADGTAFTTDELDDVEVTREGALYSPTKWSSGRRYYDIAWEHGYRTPPGDVSNAVALLAAHTISDGPWDDRGYGVVDEGGFARLLTAGVGGAAFSIPEVQSVVQRYRHPVTA